MKAQVKSVGVFAAGIVIGALAIQTLGAQEGTKRVELRKADLTGTTGTEVVMATLELQPGAGVPRHFHHGDEFLYVLEGGSFQPPGQEPVTLPTGASLHFPRAEPHGGFQVIGDKPIKVLTVHIVDKGRPLVELVN